jgi:hypothetical protein
MKEGIFMRTIRLGFVLIMLIAAMIACSFNFTTAKINSVKMTSDEGGETETSVYAPTNTFFCIVELDNAPDDTKTKAIWKVVEAEGQEPGFQIGEYELESGSGKLTFQITPDTEWPVGKYSCEIYLNDEKKETVEFEVQA